jgi:thiamine kinase-like enzyme
VTPEDRIHALGIWQGPIDISAITGGITNRNYLVRDGSVRRVVRLGEDIPVHHINRQNELAASRAAHAAGLSPAVIHHTPGVLVLDYIDARALTPDDLRQPKTLERVIPMVRACHHDIAREFRGAATIFWVFHVIRDYIASLEAAGSPYRPLFADLLEKAERLEAAGGPFEIAFGHNDMLAANFLDDGKRLWLIDWDYAGFNTPLFDLGGLASNNAFSEDTEQSDARDLLPQVTDAGSVAALPGDEMRLAAARDALEHGVGNPFDHRLRLCRLHRREPGAFRARLYGIRTGLII